MGRKVKRPVRGPDGRWTFFDQKAPQQPSLEGSVRAVDDPNAPLPHIESIPLWQRKGVGIGNPAARSSEGIQTVEDRLDKVAEEIQKNSGENRG